MRIQELFEEFKSKQEVIDHFVKQGKSAAAGAAAWERGWKDENRLQECRADTECE